MTAISDIEQPRASGRALAERHRAQPAAPASTGVLDYEERPRDDDWTMRSALVRYALPEPARAAAVLHLVRRLNATLLTARRLLEVNTVVSDTGEPDIRLADLARAVRRAGADGDAVLDGYVEVAPLEPAEEVALPLVEVALAFDALADELAGWAPAAPSPPPNASVDATVTDVGAMLDTLGVPEESGPPRRGRGGA